MFSLNRRLAQHRAERSQAHVRAAIRTLDVPSPSCDPLERQPVVAPLTFNSWRKWLSASCWRETSSDGTGSDLQIPEHEALLVCDELQNCSHDIRNVDGIVKSRSDLTKFSTLEAFARDDKRIRRYLARSPHTPTRELIECVTFKNSPKAIDRLMKSVRYNTKVRFSECAWEHRVYFAAGGASHRFAAARLMASQLGLPVVLHGPCLRYQVSPVAVKDFRARLRVVRTEDDVGFCESFRKVMEELKLPWYFKMAPDHVRPDRFDEHDYLQRDLLFALPNDPMGNVIADLLLEGGADDFGATLAALVH